METDLGTPLWLQGIDRTIKHLESWKKEKDCNLPICYKCETVHTKIEPACLQCERNTVVSREDYLNILLGWARRALKKDDPQPGRTWKKLCEHYKIDEEMRWVRIRKLL
jgi:hypothetical protein